MESTGASGSGRFALSLGGSVHYYVAASACLPVGAGLGTVLAHGVDDRLHGRVASAHVAGNVIGWVG